MKHFLRGIAVLLLIALALNAAAAIGRADSVGSIEEGKLADLVIWDAPDLNYLCYRLGSNLAGSVIKKGEVRNVKAN